MEQWDDGSAAGDNNAPNGQHPPAGARAHPAGKESALVHFAREYGWRAYAIPLLVILTAWVAVDLVRGGPLTEGDTSGAHTGPDPATVAQSAADDAGAPPGPNPQNLPLIDLPTGQLPEGGPFTETGEGTYRLVGGPSAKVGEGLQKTITYVVEIENGLDTASYGGDDSVAAMVDATLDNPKGWTHNPDYAFQHVDPGQQEPSMRIQLSSPDTVHRVCGNDLEMETSCFTGDGNRVLINEARWVRGAIPFEGDLGAYRQYLINHEVGHGIGFARHQPCGKNDALAPVMMQQTLSLNNSELRSISPTEVYEDDGKTCRANPWPYPRI